MRSNDCSEQCTDDFFTEHAKLTCELLACGKVVPPNPLSRDLGEICLLCIRVQLLNCVARIRFSSAPAIVWKTLISCENMVEPGDLSRRARAAQTVHRG